tara:strand:+ start:53 stop:454 length:402 start_codon:yes stop_codon:yes gene_type:complete
MSGATDRYGRDYDDPEYGNYGIEPGRGNSGIRPNRMQKFGQALEAAAAYKKKRQAENEADAEVGKNGDDDDAVGPKGFKIGSDSTVVTGYRDPGFTLKGVQGRSLLGPIGAGVGIFNPALGRGISAVGGLTGL